MKFKDAFSLTAEKYGKQDSIAILLSHIPQDFFNVTINFNRESKQFSYIYGSMYTTRDGRPFALGSTHFFTTDQLFYVMYRALELLDEGDLCAYYKYLFNPDKHADAIIEFRPIFPLKSDVKIKYEVDGSDDKKNRLGD